MRGEYNKEVQKRYYDAHLQERRAVSLQYYHKNRQKRLAYSRSWRLKNTARVKEDWRQRHLVKRAFLDSLKDRPCMDCGIKYPPYCMDFDHKQDKITNVSNLLYSPKEKLLNEISKCDLVCANCHRIRTHKRGLN